MVTFVSVSQTYFYHFDVKSTYVVNFIYKINYQALCTKEKKGLKKLLELLLISIFSYK